MKTNKKIKNINLAQLLEEKYSIYKITFKQFVTYNAHLGSTKKKRNRTNNNFVFSTTTQLDLINLNKAITTLRSILPIITDIILKKGFVLTIGESYVFLEQYLLKMFSLKSKQHFLGCWKPGALSNFKKLKEQGKTSSYHLQYIPNFIVILTSTHNIELHSEITPYNIPCAIIQNLTAKNLKFLYQIPLNIERYYIKYLLCEIICNSILIGYNKRILYFTTNKIKILKKKTKLS